MSKRTITLTAHPPVIIEEDEWPIVAAAKDWDNQYEVQANRKWKLFVRQHEDGRAVVYGVFTTQFQGEADRRGGKLVEKAYNVPAAIYEVAEYLEFKRVLADECIADLPAVVL